MFICFFFFFFLVSGKCLGNHRGKSRSCPINAMSPHPNWRPLVCQGKRGLEERHSQIGQPRLFGLVRSSRLHANSVAATLPPAGYDISQRVCCEVTESDRYRPRLLFCIAVDPSASRTSSLPAYAGNRLHPVRPFPRRKTLSV